MENPQNTKIQQSLIQTKWWHRTLKYANIASICKLYSFSPAKPTLIAHLGQQLIFPTHPHSATLEQAKLLLPHTKLLQVLKLNLIALNNSDDLVDLLLLQPNVSTIHLPGQFMANTQVLIYLIHMNKLKKLKVIGDVPLISCFELLTSSKKLQYFSCEHSGLVEADHDNIDRVFYSKRNVLQGLSCCVGAINSQFTSLSLQYYGNLQFLSIKLLCESQFELCHQQLQKLIISADLQVMVFGINCQNLKEINISENAFVSQENFFNLLNLKYIVSASLNVCGDVNLNQSKLNTSLEILKINNFLTIFDTFSNNLLKASIIQQCAYYFPNLTNLQILNINTQVIDKHMFSLLVNNNHLQKLVITCTHICQNQLFFAAENPKDNFFSQNKQEISSLAQALIYPNTLRHLNLQNLHITDQFFYAIFIYQHNYSLKDITFKNLQLITDTGIFLLLTSTEIRNQSKQTNIRKSFSAPISENSEIFIDKRQQSMVLTNKSFQSKFSIAFFDGIIEEQIMYEIERLEIINCSQISRKICSAIFLAGYQLKYLKLTIPLGQKFIKQLKNQRPGIKVEGGRGL